MAAACKIYKHSAPFMVGPPRFQLGTHQKDYRRNLIMMDIGSSAHLRAVSPLAFSAKVIPSLAFRKWTPLPALGPLNKHTLKYAEAFLVAQFGFRIRRRAPSSGHQKWEGETEGSKGSTLFRVYLKIGLGTLTRASANQPKTPSDGRCSFRFPLKPTKTHRVPSKPAPEWQNDGFP